MHSSQKQQQVAKKRLTGKKIALTFRSCCRITFLGAGVSESDDTSITVQQYINSH